MIITKKWLEQKNACQDGIDFVTRNKIIPFDYFKIKIIGDYNDYFWWLQDEIKKNIKYKYEYDKKGNIVKKTNKFMRTWLFEYDKYNNKTKTIFPNKAFYIWKYEYDKKGNIVKKIQFNNKKWIWQWVYDSSGNIIKEINTFKNVIYTATYDNRNNLKTYFAYDNRKFQYNYKFSADDRLIKMTCNDIEILKIEY